MANNKRMLLICCWKIFSCILWTQAVSLGLHNIRANQGRKTIDFSLFGLILQQTKERLLAGFHEERERFALAEISVQRSWHQIFTDSHSLQHCLVRVQVTFPLTLKGPMKAISFVS